MKKPESKDPPASASESLEARSPWWINSPEHDYSFWKWVNSRSYPDGYMEPLLQNEIAQLLGCSSTKVHFILKEAIEKLKKSKSLHILADFYEGAPSSSDGDMADVGSLVSSGSDSEDGPY